MHPNNSLEDFEYINGNLMPQISRTFQATLQFLPEDLRKDSVVGYALFRAIDTVEDDGSLDRSTKIGLMNGLVATFESGDLGRAKELEKRLVAVSSRKKGYRGLMDNYSKVVGASQDLGERVVSLIADCGREMVDGLSNPLIQEIKTLGDHHRYCHYAAGVVGYFITKDLVERGYLSLDRSRVLMPFTKDNNPDTGRNPSSDLATLLQLTNDIRDLHEDWDNKTLRWPIELVSSKGLSFKELVDEGNSNSLSRKVELLDEQIRDALNYLPGAVKWVDGLLNSGTDKDLSGVRTSWGFALALSVATLKKINGPQFFTDESSRKLQRHEVEKIGMWVKNLADHKGKLNYLVNNLLNG